MMTAPPPFTGLGEVHRHYLEQRGLTADTIASAGFYSARPGDLPRLAGRPVPDETSGLVITYPNAPDFCRVRLFPSVPTEDGKGQKFGQPQGSVVRAYIPRRVQSVLQDPSVSLAITEGEVKAEALTQAGWPCIGLGGIWNFRCKDLPRDEMIQDLEQIDWQGRIVWMVPDSDAWTKEQILHAIFVLARLLEARGATVMMVRLPILPEQEKTGADDYLVAKGPASFRRLVEKAVTLGHSTFRPFREREKRQSKAPPAGGPPPELAGRCLHPAVSLERDGFAAVGIVVSSPGGCAVELVTNEGVRYSADLIATALRCPIYAYPDLVDRWAAEDLSAFLQGDHRRPTFAEAMGRAIERIEATLELQRETEMVLLATWAIATWFHPLFPTFPRLDLRGERGSGKSKALAILAGLTFNGLLRVAPTPAVLFRLTETFSATLCLDEIEGLDREDRREILAILNAGYKRGARVDRCEGDDHQLRSWSVYAPVALAGIAGLNRITEDRAITLVLTRGIDRARLNSIVDPTDDRFAAARATCYRLVLLRWKDVAKAWKALRCPAWLVGRERELWTPLLTIRPSGRLRGWPRVDGGSPQAGPGARRGTLRSLRRGRSPCGNPARAPRRSG